MAVNPNIQLVDCTLREGEQTAGIWFTVEEKLLVVDALAKAGVTTLDAGMPVVSSEEREFLTRAVGRTHCRIGASVRLLEPEVRLALDCGVDDVFLICPASPLHRKQRLKLSEAELLKRIEQLCRLITQSGRRAYVVAEDASRTELNSLQITIDAALAADASVVYLCDTVGCWRPSQVVTVFSSLSERYGGERLGVHCHNDYGMATANTVAAVEAGAHFPTATINGVGERAGNASLIEVAAACEQLLNCATNVDFPALKKLSQTVEQLTGFVVPQHQPLVGYNAFRHESGIHVDGIIKDPETYESLSPELIGRSHHFVVGKHSGRALLRRYAVAHNWPDDDETINAVLDRVKQRRPDWARESFERVRSAIDSYNHTCLGVPEQHLNQLFSDVCRVKKCQP